MSNPSVYEPVKPEPISGFTDLGPIDSNYTNKWVKIGGEGFTHFPVGTLIQQDGRPEIYLVCSETQICHINDWTTYTSRRPWLDSANPTARVVKVKSDATGCYSMGSDIASSMTMKLVVCNGADKYVVFRDSTHNKRRYIPFAQSDSKYAPLIKSWGFRTDELQAGTSQDCNDSTQGEDLKVRVGTLFAEASDNDFWVVTAGEYRFNDADLSCPQLQLKRVMREELVSGRYVKLAYETYRGFGNFIQVPDGSITALTGLSTSGAPYFTYASASACMTGSGGGGQGGGLVGACNESDRRCENSSTYAYCVMDYTTWTGHWSAWPCPYGTQCTSYSGLPGQCMPVEQPLPQHTIRCDRNGETYTVSITGPIQDGLWNSVSGQTVYLEYGSNTDGWGSHTTGKPLTPWTGDWSGTRAMKYELKFSDTVQDTNFFLYSPDTSQQGWFDLVNNIWTVSGDCSLVGTSVHFSNSSSEPATGKINCTMVDSYNMVVDILGPIQDLLVGGSVANPVDIEYGSNTDGWSVPYASGKPKTVWNGMNHHTLTLSPGTNEFNLYLKGANSGQWFDLTDADWDGDSWSVTGDCWKDGGLIKHAPAPPVGVIDCSVSGSSLIVQIAGDIRAGVFDTTPTGSTTYLEYGSDTDGWGPYTSGKPNLSWTDSELLNVLTLSDSVQNMNFFLYTPATSQVNWFNLNLWNITGSCWRDGGGIRH